MSDLSAPLSRRRVRQGQAPGTTRRGWPVARIAFGAIALLLAGVTARIVLVDEPLGGRPVAEVAINNTRNDNAVAVGNSADVPQATIVADPETPVEALPPADDQPPEAATGALPNADGLVPDLMEQTEFGPIPRMSGTGQTPFSAYSRASETPATAAGKPLIAIVVTGLGLNPSGTVAAMDKLPDDITLAFAPYGKALERTVATARSQGHEVFLEVPLEPFDYPDNDPGPDTLLTGQAPRDNLNKLFNVMSKFGGYVGLINNMGARFTASGADFGPMMEELGARGLGYLDDGSSNRSLAPQLAKANRVPFSRADLMLDANPARAPILEQLAALEAKAREKGSAIGVVSALPVSVETIAEWATGLEDKGILIVPASALMKD